MTQYHFLNTATNLFRMIWGTYYRYAKADCSAKQDTLEPFLYSTIANYTSLHSHVVIGNPPPV
jgi:hypothetical protein